MNNPELFPEYIQDTVEPDYDENLTLRERFEAFHAANPHVYALCVREALDSRSRGWARWSIQGIFEILRWKRSFSTSASKFKLNNNHRPFYARLIMEQVPELEGFFSTRKAVADEEVTHG